MPNSIPPELLKRIAEATVDLAAAQKEVERAMRETTAGEPRAQKTIITEALRNAFEKLTAAREKLEAVTAESSS